MWRSECASHVRGTRSGPVCASTLTDRLLCVLQRTPIAVALVVLATLLPRVLALDRFVTPDESLWVTRAGHFACALRQGDWAGTFQREHPGVTTTWAGVIGLWTQVSNPVEFCEGLIEGGHQRALRDLGVEPIAVLEAGRFLMVLFNVSVLTIAFLYARRLLGPLPALLGFLFIAYDPFHVAHSRLLHLDGLLSSLMLLAVLGFSSYLRSRRTRDLIVSGTAIGLASLTKSPALVMLAVIVVLDLLHRWWSGYPYGCRSREVLADSPDR